MHAFFSRYEPLVNFRQHPELGLETVLNYTQRSAVSGNNSAENLVFALLCDTCVPVWLVTTCYIKNKDIGLLI